MNPKPKSQVRKYDRVTLDVLSFIIQNRKLLVELVVQNERSLTKTAKKIGIKLSTAKLILRRFKKTGTYYQTEKQKR